MSKSVIWLIEEFPDFDNAWSDERKLKWFDDFIQLLKRLNRLSRRKSG